VDVADRLAGLGIPWWIAGGWTLDLAAGRALGANGGADVAARRSRAGVRPSNWPI
jgi:hypothetical protein